VSNNKRAHKKFKGNIRISFDEDEQLSVCEHIIINATSVTREDYDDAEYIQRLNIWCSECKTIFTFKAAIN